MMSKISFEIDKKNLIQGMLLVGVGIIAPCIIHVKNFKIYQLLYASIENSDKGALIIAAFKLVILNSLRALPNYMATFIMIEGIKIYVGERRIKWLSGFLGVVIIPTVYMLIRVINQIKYHLGAPAFMIIILIIFIEKLDLKRVGLFKKSFIIILLLLGVQWMDIIPGLSRFGFGRGEISKDVKNIATFIDGRDALTFAAIAFFVIFTMNALLIYKILKDENELIDAIEENKRVEKELAETRLQALEARTSQEIQNLVHDLKTPLMSIQTLVSVMELMINNQQIQRYLSKINISVDKLNAMISEILYENNKSIICIEELFEIVLAQLSTHKHVDKIKFINECPHKKLLANKIRLSRAIINSINNSFDAIDKEHGNIYLKVKGEKDRIIIDIEDDGIGIDKEVIENIWDRGFSTKISSGIGLKFMQDVINNHQGDITISSEVNKGTQLTISLPEVTYDE
ncbi:MAG: HAMP domain-containing histidine kinase [Marinisporobacter sp.]|nr:HAMP domain-containing histidine kinase [Marinisporobacter sp.]